MDIPKKMQLMELEYQERSGLRDRDWYTIFFSQLCSADLLVLGINPGGDPLKPNKIIRASTTYYENWEHEYVDSRYPIQEAMLPFLKNVLSTNNDGIRRVPKSNLAFRRSPGEDKFESLHKMTMAKGMQEAKATIEEILTLVSPNMILLECMKPEKFRQLYCNGPAMPIRDNIYTKYRKSDVRIFYAAAMHIECLGRQIPVVAVGHPSRFGSKPAWGGSVVPATRELVQEYGIKAQRDTESV